MTVKEALDQTRNIDPSRLVRCAQEIDKLAEGRNDVSTLERALFAAAASIGFEAGRIYEAEAHLEVVR
jgi:hypothetical protein